MSKGERHFHGCDKDKAANDAQAHNVPAEQEAAMHLHLACAPRAAIHLQSLVEAKETVTALAQENLQALREVSARVAPPWWAASRQSPRRGALCVSALGASVMDVACATRSPWQKAVGMRMRLQENMRQSLGQHWWVALPHRQRHRHCVFLVAVHKAMPSATPI